MIKSQTISEALKEFGFIVSSYKLINGYKISKFYSNSSNLYCGWQSFPSAPINRSVNWSQIFIKHQRIKISNKFQHIKPLKLKTGINFLSAFYFIGKQFSPQFNNSHTLEFQNILAVFENGVQRSTRTGDVFSFDFDCIYKIITLQEDVGYVCICKEEDFNNLELNSINYEKMQILHLSIFTFVDLVEIIN